MVLVGEYGVITEIMVQFFRRVGGLTRRFRVPFGMSDLLNNEIVVCNQFPKDLEKLLPIGLFNSMVSLRMMSVPIRRKSPVTMTWTTPVLFSGEHYPNYLVNGKVSRRILVAKFKDFIVDRVLIDEIISRELGAILVKSLTLYQQALDADTHCGVLLCCPKYFLDERAVMEEELNRTQ